MGNLSDRGREIRPHRLPPFRLSMIWLACLRVSWEKEAILSSLRCASNAGSKPRTSFARTRFKMGRPDRREGALGFGVQGAREVSSAPATSGSAQQKTDRPSALLPGDHPSGCRRGQNIHT